MFGMSMTEVMIILVVALLVLGPNELPKAARTLGKTLRDVRRASEDLRDTFEREVMADKPPPKIRPPDGEPVSSAPVAPTTAPEAMHAAPTEPPAEPAPPAALAADAALHLSPTSADAPEVATPSPLAGLEVGPDPFAVADSKDRA